ncbi:MAG: M13 family metallopeptidase [Lachnospiraceae bacterium]
MKWKKSAAIGCALIMAVECAFVFTPVATVKAAGKDAGSSWIESDIKGNVTTDTVVSHKDDFSAAVNKEWLSTTVIPEGYSSYDAFSEADDVMRERKLSLIHDSTLKSHDASLVKTFYDLSGDWASRNEAGVSSALPYIEAVRSISTTDDLTKFLINEDENKLGLVFSGVGTTASYSDATRYTVYIDEPVYFLNYPDDYTEMSVTGQMYYEYDQQLVSYMLQRFGYSEQEANDIFDGAIRFESMMAPYLYTAEDQSSVDYINKTNNVYSLQEIGAMEGSYPIAEMLAGTGYGQSVDYMVANPDFIRNFGKLYTNENIELIKDYLLAHEASMFSGLLDRDAYETKTSISNSVFGGSGTISDEEYCYDIVNSYLAWPLDNLYVDTSTVNAFYNPSMNAIYFLAGQLVPPLLDDENNYEEFLALVGETFGHEMSHAFDTNGAQFDANGNVTNWWTDEDYSAYMARTQKVVDYLDSITPFEDHPELHIDGELVKTEYVADLVSLKHLIEMAKQYEKDQNKEFDGDLFFQAYSVQWRKISSEESEISQMQSDEHPLNYLRVNAVLQHYQEFYDTYDIQPGDGMYLAPEDRLKVW